QTLNGAFKNMTNPIRLAGDEVLIVTDVQRDLCKDGSWPVSGAAQAVTAINAIAPRFATVIFTQAWYPKGHPAFGNPFAVPVHCLMGSNGATFHPDLNTNSGEIFIRKGTRPAFDGTGAFFRDANRRIPFGLKSMFNDRGISSVFVAGLGPGVASTAIDAARCGFNVYLIDDATGLHDSDHSEMDKKLEKEGILRISSKDLQAPSASVTRYPFLSLTTGR
ncbi:MAG: isochorismatase family protein, partial [Pseudomonadota bacterium]|nr:isochorismatase family protein [Pseudomonadota bacterium]